MTTALARRLEKLEAVRRDQYDKRWRIAIDGLLRSMSREHVAEVQGWMRKHCGGLQLQRLPGDTWYSLLERYRPPALVRAVWVLMHAHMATRVPISLVPEVAEVYRADADAFPVNPCDGCGYLMPARARVLPDSTYRHLRGFYEGVCPVCETDTRTEPEVAP